MSKKFKKCFWKYKNQVIFQTFLDNEQEDPTLYSSMKNTLFAWPKLLMSQPEDMKLVIGLNNNSYFLKKHL